MVLVVVMGVSGSGKSTVGSLLAKKLGWKFYDADDYHSDGNKLKMAKGIPLTDQDRIPWLGELHKIIREGLSSENIVLACSALKRVYRDILTNEESTALSQEVKKDEMPPSRPFFVHLDGSMELILQRLEKRKGHFMPSALLQSQFDTLEPLSAPEHFIIINVEKNVLDIVSEIERMLVKSNLEYLQ
ncbi:putative gluconokinase [Microcaecilia unicolor]|uniref:Gluconokinase n=1 Tax=Microcaecilia unicolor TaxID=1415580 RepID=A0A6P7X4F7_9AMPH|nr:probable gluconokinase [Microcaecilia unicolor]